MNSVADKNGYSSNEDCLNKNLYIIKVGLLDIEHARGQTRALKAIDSIQEYFKIGKYMEA